MPDYRTFYEKDYLGAWNIPESGEWTVTIVKCVQGELNNPGTKKKTKKPVVYVKESEKQFALNATNGKTIAGLYGNKTEAWAGKRITLYKSMTRNPQGGDDVECLRVRAKEPGETVADEPITLEHANELKALCEKAGVPEAKFLAMAKSLTFVGILEADYETGRAYLPPSNPRRRFEGGGMTDRELLIWIHQRMVKVHGESPYYGYMHHLRAIIHNADARRESSTANMDSMNALKEIERAELAEKAKRVLA